MPSGVTFTALAAGAFHTCALTDDGAAFCWGTNDDGQLGDGSTNQGDIPVAVSLPAGVTFSSLSAGSYHTCGITHAGAAYCWGLDEVGQLGDGHVYDGSVETSTVPVAVVMPPGVSFTTVVSGYGHNCALSSTGKAYCWGNTYLGAVDDGSVDDSPVPVPVVSGLTFPLVSGR
jgi:alpha-tubulin suppressor-like RCC1 family protein